MKAPGARGIAAGSRRLFRIPGRVAAEFRWADKLDLFRSVMHEVVTGERPP